jgi:hypothetical protein
MIGLAGRPENHSAVRACVRASEYGHTQGGGVVYGVMHEHEGNLTGRTPTH